MRAVIHRLGVTPWATVIGALVFFSGVLGLLNVAVERDPLALALPTWLLAVTQILYAVSGLAMLVGIGFGRADVEAAGLIGVGFGITSRAVAFVAILGLTPAVAVTLWFSAWVIWACAWSLWRLFRGDVVVVGRVDDGEST
jgi:hypothetical protein